MNSKFSKSVNWKTFTELSEKFTFRRLRNFSVEREQRDEMTLKFVKRERSCAFTSINFIRPIRIVSCIMLPINWC